jgi:hypothetical protein
MRVRFFGLTIGAGVMGLALGGGCSDGDPSSDPGGDGGEGGGLIVDGPDPEGTGGRTPPPVVTCCEAGSECEPGLAPCALECPDSEVSCAAGDLCAENAEGEVKGCIKECPEARRCEDVCCAEGATCDEEGTCQAADLRITDVSLDPEAFRTVEVSGASCEVQDGCYGDAGKRTIIPFEITVENVGDGPLAIGEPWKSDAFYLSACSSQYRTAGFVTAEVLSPAGDVVAVQNLPTSCIQDPTTETYRCSLQGLLPGESSAQPSHACDGLDVTGLTPGEYTVRFTVNGARSFAESDFSNNSIEVELEKPECDAHFCGGVCCPEGIECRDGQCMLPDLRANEDAVLRSLVLGKEVFGENSCEIAEMCITGPGKRRLLKFEGRIENLGPGDLDAGPEQNNPLFEFSECHGHYHFLDFTSYRLLTSEGEPAAFGHKQSFCLINMEEVEDYEGPSPGVHPEPGETGCNYLKAGWADIYGVGTPCQWIDVTDVPPGDYILELAVNPTGKIAETSVANNLVRVPINLPADAPCQEEEICGDIVDQDCDGLSDAEDYDCRDSSFCCGDEDRCGLGDNFYCECDGLPAWEHGDCHDHGGMGGSGGNPDEECCDESDPCNWGWDGICDCDGDFSWDENDCTGGGGECCNYDDPCGWANDGYCDCGGTMPWDAIDCAGGGVGGGPVIIGGP